MRRQSEKILKKHSQWNGRNQNKRIKIVMTVVLIAIFFSLAAAVLLTWIQMKGAAQPPTGSLSADAGTDSGNSGGLPIYDDSLNLLLVNSSHILSSGYQPQLTSFEGIQLDERILPALGKMMEKAKTDGYPLTLAGAYVDSKQQNQLYQAEVQRLMQQDNLSLVRAENQAQNTVGEGGYNENQTGLAVTFSFAGKQGTKFASTGQYHWLSQNSVYYGFVLRYPKDKESMTGMDFEPDHFRYVGRSNAIKMREYSMCLEEYVSYLQQQTQS